MSINVSTSKSRIIMAFAAIYIIWGSTYLAIRFTIETLPPFLSAGLRFFLAGIILYSLMKLSKAQCEIQPQHWKSSIITGAFLLVGGNGSVVTAEKYIPSGIASLFIAATPLWMVLLQWVFDREKKPTAGVLFGIAIGFLGVWLLIGPSLEPMNTKHLHVGGALLLLTGSLSWAFGSIYSRQAVLPKNPFVATAIQMISGGSLLMILGFLMGEMNFINPSTFSVKSIAAFVYLVLVGSLIGFTAYIWLLKNVGVAKTSTYAFVNPVVAVFLGWALAGETLTFQTILAAIFVVAAVVIITFSQQKTGA